MFVFRTQEDRLNLVEGALRSGPVPYRSALRLFSDYRTKVRADISQFNHIQGQGSDATTRLPDGRQGTILDARADTAGPYAISKKPGRLLRSLDIASAVTIESTAAEDYSYACPMSLTRDATLNERDGHPVGLVVYLDLIQTAYVVWIGTRAELGDGWKLLDEWTEQLTRFAAIDPAYNEAVGGQP
ncbi:MAG: hypothetical protein AAFQ13_10575 [Pseudomonadota bacterium]